MNEWFTIRDQYGLKPKKQPSLFFYTSVSIERFVYSIIIKKRE